jgi:hypothetical protein
MKRIIVTAALFTALPVMANSTHEANTTGNTNVQSSNVQGQRQVQSQRATQRIRNQNTTGASTSSANAAPATATTSDANNAAQSVNLTHTRNPVSTAYAAAIPPTAVCAGSTSGGAQGAAVGLSFGSSWTDKNCMLLEQVRTVAVVLGDVAVASEMLCGVDAYREARQRLGNPCKYSPSAVTDKRSVTTDSKYIGG